MTRKRFLSREVVVDSIDKGEAFLRGCLGKALSFVLGDGAGTGFGAGAESHRRLVVSALLRGVCSRRRWVGAGERSLNAVDSVRMSFGLYFTVSLSFLGQTLLKLIESPSSSPADRS